MSLNPDYIVAAKVNKKSIFRWKLVAFLMFCLLIYNIFGTYGDNFMGDSDHDMGFAASDHIARISFEEIIYDNLPRARKLEAIKNNDKIKAVIIHINSMGGTVVGSEMLYNALVRIGKSKPVVAVLGSVAASGGYLTALGADYIVAYNGTITGSIGVIMQSMEITELAKLVGVSFENFKSSPLKASPNPLEKVTPEARSAIMSNVEQIYDYFTAQVALRRKLPLTYVRNIADGRIYSAKQALSLKLIDAIGDEETALSWLQDKKNIAKHLKVVDTKISTRDNLLELLVEDFSSKILSMFSMSAKLLM